MSRADPNRNVRWEMVKNTHGTDCPPYGLLKPTGVIDDVGRIECTRPDADSDTSVMVNGPNTIPAGMSGEATLHPIAPVAYDDAETPGANEEWGSAVDSWLLTKNKQGFRIRGGDDGESVVTAREAGVGGGGDTSIWVRITGAELTGGDAGFWPFEQSLPQTNATWNDSTGVVGHFFPVPPIAPVVNRRYRAWPVGTRLDADSKSKDVYVGGWNVPEMLSYSWECTYGEEENLTGITLKVKIDGEDFASATIPAAETDVLTDVNCATDGSIAVSTATIIRLLCPEPEEE